MTQRPFADVKALVGKAFASIEPKFSVETLSFEKSGLFVNASLTPVDDGYLLVVDHNYSKQSSSPGMIVARFIGLGPLWYFGGIWLAFAGLAVFGLIQSLRRFSADRIEQCVANLKNIVV